ncbi:hypothetical protein PUN28_003378 [Cardiocondyla obscurior]|uniref:Uncharacterized protein n=1 Tax=Cardiocondyla obscurior TaxID=286306 RepID=A0AAW2GIP9_9HYME
MEFQCRVTTVGRTSSLQLLHTSSLLKCDISESDESDKTLLEGPIFEQNSFRDKISFVKDIKILFGVVLAMRGFFLKKVSEQVDHKAGFRAAAALSNSKTF